MNVMTVTDVVADAQIPVKSDPQGDSQGFASELNRASNTETAGKDVKATAAQKTVNEDQPGDRSDGETKDDKSKDTQQANTAQLLQGAIPVIVQAPGQETAQAAGQTDAATAVVTQAVDAAAVQNTQQTAQLVPAEADLAQTATNATQTAQTAQAAVQTATDGYAQAALNAEAATTEDKAQAFANQAAQEISMLQKAANEDGKQPAAALTKTDVAETDAVETAAAETPVATTTVAQTTAPKQDVKAQAQEQQTQAETVQQQGDAKVAAVKADGDEASGDKKDQSGTQLQKQDNGIAQTQTPLWTAANEHVTQQIQPQAEQSAVRQTVATTIVDQVTTAVNNNKTEMVVQLKPEHLGGLAITLSMGEDGITAKMVTSQENVQNMIHNQIGVLQDSLREKGIPVVHMEVVYDQTQNSANFSHSGSNGHGATPHGSTNSNQGYNETEETVNYRNLMSSYDVLAEHGGSVEFSA